MPNLKLIASAVILFGIGAGLSAYSGGPDPEAETHEQSYPTTAPSSAALPSTPATIPAAAPIIEPAPAPVINSNIETAAPTLVATANQVAAPQLTPEPVAAPLTITQKFDALLSRHIRTDATGLNRFNYGAVKNSASESQILNGYIAHLEAQNPDRMSTAQATAYWANLYNAVTVKLIVDNYPLPSIKKIRGPWKKKLVTVNGKALSLNNIEHDILRKQFASPLIHYMVNCASVGCPNLRTSLWKAETLDADRADAARDFINSSRGVRISDKNVVVSKIYKWFQGDFGGNKSAVLNHIKRYGSDDLRVKIDSGARIEKFEYDWSLNDLPNIR